VPLPCAVFHVGVTGHPLPWSEDSIFRDSLRFSPPPPLPDRDTPLQVHQNVVSPPLAPGPSPCLLFPSWPTFPQFFLSTSWPGSAVHSLFSPFVATFFLFFHFVFFNSSGSHPVVPQQRPSGAPFLRERTPSLAAPQRCTHRLSCNRFFPLFFFSLLSRFPFLPLSSAPLFRRGKTPGPFDKISPPASDTSFCGLLRDTVPEPLP